MEHKMKITPKAVRIVRISVMCISITYIIYDIYTAQYWWLLYWIGILIINWFGYRMLKLREADSHNRQSHTRRKESKSEHNSTRGLTAVLSAWLILPFKK